MTSTKILIGDCREKLRELPDNSVHCVVTSPPYWGQRDYGKGGIGFERYFEDHLKTLCGVFDEVRRVLRKDGSLWFNYGDCYYGGNRGAVPGDAERVRESSPIQNKHKGSLQLKASPNRLPQRGVKNKDMMLIPEQMALAFRARGWWARSRVVWYKRNPMPDSALDRPSRTYEDIYIFTKSRLCYYDHVAVRVPSSTNSHPRRKDGREGLTKGHDPNNRWHEGRRGIPGLYETASMRNVWEITAEPFLGTHFATFPKAVVTPCIKAGTSEKGACVECGSPYRRRVKRGYSAPSDRKVDDVKSIERRRDSAGFGHRFLVNYHTVGWTKTCKCETNKTKPCVVLDPFGGSGTVGLVAQALGRDSILIEMNPEYAEMARDRIYKEGSGLFLDSVDVV